MDDYDKQRLAILEASTRTLNREMGEVLGELKSIRKRGNFDLVGRVAEIIVLVVILVQLL